MKVKDLIAALQKHDPEHMVVVNGYEDGVDEVVVIRAARVELNAYGADYFGAHKLSKSGPTPVVYVGVRPESEWEQ
jgi:hypothetical protein